MWKWLRSSIRVRSAGPSARATGRRPARSRRRPSSRRADSRSMRWKRSCPVDGHQPPTDQPRPRAQTENLPEHPRQRVLVRHPKPSDPRMIRQTAHRDHPKRNVFGTTTLDPATGTLTHAIRVDKQRHHHRRLIRRSATTVTAIHRHERRQVKLRDHVQHEPRQVIRRQPLDQRRRHQQQLIAISNHEVVNHGPSSHRTRKLGATVEIRATASLPGIMR
jgi:hypothetical protein